MADMIRTLLVEQKMIYDERIARLINERDEARRQVCDLKSFNYEQRISPEQYAELNKWDCYKDHNNG